jgi:hypothetical protein
MGWGEQLKLTEKDPHTAALQQALGELREQKSAEAAAAAVAAGEGLTTQDMLAALQEAAEGSTIADARDAYSDGAARILADDGC